MSEDHYEWLAQYLVVKRASIEPNFHALYVLLLETFRSQQLGRYWRRTRDSEPACDASCAATDGVGLAAHDAARAGRGRGCGRGVRPGGC